MSLLFCFQFSHFFCCLFICRCSLPRYSFPFFLLLSSSFRLPFTLVHTLFILLFFDSFMGRCEVRELAPKKKYKHTGTHMHACARTGTHARVHTELFTLQSPEIVTQHGNPKASALSTTTHQCPLMQPWQQDPASTAPVLFARDHFGGLKGPSAQVLTLRRAIGLSSSLLCASSITSRDARHAFLLLSLSHVCDSWERKVLIPL